ncbi:SLC13 family permease [Bacilliculturomica massiliensis]|uniref:SLC13 family permease n=1 Tax=Bacilliculturomica massiliensis TaxID=1917867 RepID=UPI0010305129|nr:SLC13 family permease [Bacilliculturomica massiliensis]
MKQNVVKLIKFLLAVVVGLLIAFVPPATEAMNAGALAFLGIFTSMIVLMIFGLFPDAITVLLALTMIFACGIADFTTVFSGFASSTVWMVVALVGFATGVVNSGLMKRVAFQIMKLFRPTYNSQILAVMMTGVVLTPCIPNMLAKVAIVAPFTTQIASEFGLPKNSRGAAGLFSALLYPSNVFGLCFLTGSTMVYMLIGIIGQSYSWLSWTGATIVWGVVCLIGFYFFNITYYKADVKELPADLTQKELAKLGPMTENEKYAAAVLALGIAAWMTTSLTGLDSFVIAVALWLLMIIKGLFTIEELSLKIPWTVIIIAGGITGLSTLFSLTGVSSWLQMVLEPVLSTFVTGGFMLVLTVTISTYLLRYFVVSMIATVTIMFAIFSPVCTALSISPFVVVWCAYTAAQVWSLSFNNTTFIMAQGVSDQLANWRSAVPSCYCYMFLNLLGNLCCIPVWHLMGVM